MSTSFTYFAKGEAFLREALHCKFVAVKVGWFGWLAQDVVRLFLFTSESLAHYLFHCRANLFTQLQETVIIPQVNT